MTSSSTKRTWAVTFAAGYFSHEEQPIGPESGFRARTLPALGLIKQLYPTDVNFDPDHKGTQWEHFSHHILDLNQASSDVRYKLLFVARHGDGVHNLKEAAVGRHEWESTWASLSGDGTLEWEDALLTASGEADAVAAREFWTTSVEIDKIPFPDKFFSSPLRRCIQTTNLTFGPLLDARGDGLGVESGREPWLDVVDELREIYGKHTSDRRRERNELVKSFPFIRLDPDFPAGDDQWQPDRRETLIEATQRLRGWVETLFAKEDATFLSVTTHSGAIRALYRAVGHPDVWLARGAVTPLLLKGEMRRM